MLCSDVPTKVIEFFAGIGGLHYALRNSGVPAYVVCAFDIDSSAVATYRHNLPDTKVSTQSIASLSLDHLRGLAANCWLLSPPCQPHTRQGLQMGDADARSSALMHLIDLIECCDDGVLPDSLLLENVVGFESSSVRQRLYDVLVGRKYNVREFWASPVHFGVPNQRTRYFLLASHVNEMKTMPPAPLNQLLLEPSALEAACAPDGERLPPPRGEVSAALQQACSPLAEYLLPAGSSELEGSAVAEHVLERYGAAMDLVSHASRRSLCFTKNYSRYVKGTGSVLCERPLEEGAQLVGEDKSLAVLRRYQPRFFAPREIANLHGFPTEFSFPSDVGRKKQFELLGNSLSIQVLAQLLRYLLDHAGHAESRRAESVAATSAAVCV